MLKKGLLKDFDDVAYTATVQLDGSMGTWWEDIAVSRGIASGEMTAGRQCVIVCWEDSALNAVIVAVY